MLEFIAGLGKSAAVTGSAVSQTITSLTTFCKDFTLFLRISTNTTAKGKQHTQYRSTARPVTADCSTLHSARRSLSGCIGRSASSAPICCTCPTPRRSGRWRFPPRAGCRRLFTGTPTWWRPCSGRRARRRGGNDLGSNRWQRRWRRYTGGCWPPRNPSLPSSLAEAELDVRD